MATDVRTRGKVYNKYHKGETRLGKSSQAIERSKETHRGKWQTAPERSCPDPGRQTPKEKRVSTPPDSDPQTGLNTESRVKDLMEY